jgi:hypothetical protein
MTIFWYLSFLRLPYLQGQVPVFISLGYRAAQLYPRISKISDCLEYLELKAKIKSTQPREYN